MKETERQEYISDSKDENFFVVGHRNGGTPVLLAATGTEESAERYAAMFEEHLVGYAKITVDVAGGLSPWEMERKAARKARAS